MGLDKIKDLDSLLNYLRTEIKEHKRKAKEYQITLDRINEQIDIKVRRDASIDIVKIATASRVPVPTFYCAKEYSIMKQMKCIEQCLSCKAAINVLGKDK